MKRGRRGVWLFLSLAGLILLNSQALASAPSTNCRIEFLDNRLTVDAENVSLGSVLGKIHEKTGVEFEVGKDQCQRSISVSFQSLPLVEALKRILKRFSYGFLWGPDGKIQKAIILGNYEKKVVSSGRQIEQVSFDPQIMVVGPPSKEGMEIMFSSESTMVFEPSKGEEMEITRSSEPMLIDPPSLNSLMHISEISEHR